MSQFAKNIIDFHKQILQLKQLIRKGWQLKGIIDPETVASHSYAVATLSIHFCKRLDLDMEKVLIISLIHELGEIVVGDITPHDNISAEEKSHMEENAVKEILSGIDQKGYLLELWKDFEYKRTPEGRLVKELDKLEMALQAHYYEESQGVCLEEFYESAENEIYSEGVKEIFNILKSLRK